MEIYIPQEVIDHKPGLVYDAPMSCMPRQHGRTVANQTNEPLKTDYALRLNTKDF
ncbi:hypothetical protein [Pedobacter sp.]|uniref:hypothetical protein n=1 Tax=Pedobacter sp. TaxID=1411316 RepID=UPI003D7FC53B